MSTLWRKANMFRLLTLSIAAIVAIEGAIWQSSRGQEQEGRKANASESYDRLRVGEGADGKIVVPTNQVLSPAGRQVAFSGRPTDVALSPNGKWLAVLDRGQVVLIDPAEGKVASRVSHASGSYAGIVFASDSKKILASHIRGSIGVFEIEENCELEKLPPIPLPAIRDVSGANLANSPTGPQSPNSQGSPPGADARNAV